MLHSAFCETNAALLASFRRALTHRRDVMLRAARNGQETVDDFARAVTRGLRRRPARLECRFLYDAAGSALYERICAQPEYYPARTEAAILRHSAHEIMRLAGPATIVELGSGSSTKTGPLLAAALQAHGTVRYVPVDISAAALWQAGQVLARPGPELQFIGVHGEYGAALPLFSLASPLLVLFLGGTMGNLDDRELSKFLAAAARHMGRGDLLLLGVDLVKSPALLNAAYNDDAGVTAAFTRNLFVRMNRELGSSIDLGAVVHEAAYHPERRQVEIGARFTREQRIWIEPLGEERLIAAGERVETEVSRKYHLEQLLPWLEGFGFATERVFVDDRGWFADILLRRKED